MDYRIVPLKRIPNLLQEDTFGVRTGRSLDEAVSNLENGIQSGSVRRPLGEAIVYVYSVTTRDFEAVLTDNFQYLPSLPEVIVKDNRKGRERF